jgi:hypothetical protein
MALPFVNPVSQSMPGFGSPSNNGSASATITTATTTTITIAATSTTPSTGGTGFNLDGAPPPSRGKLHLRMLTISATTAITSIQFTVTDGTTVATVDLVGPFTAAQITDLDYVQEFDTDLQITSVSAIIITTGTAISSVVDFEVSMV